MRWRSASTWSSPRRCGLIDLLKEDELDLSAIEIVVLDEADRMADDGFTPQVEWILRKVTGPHQTMLFSATLDGDVGHLVRRYMTDRPRRSSPSMRRPTRSARCTTSSSPCTTWTSDRVVATIAADHRQDARVLPDQARLRPRRAQPVRASACRRWPSTATSPRWPASGR
jgi:hypothetical protein